jgi:hypothetical protein
MFVGSYLTERGLSHIDSLGGKSLTGIYNRAFGAHFQDGVAGIAEAFSEQLTGSQMLPDTTKRFYVEFYAILKGLFDDFKSMKLVSNRR